MHVGVCDFPTLYSFPPKGYAGIERWLWATALGARRAGATVDLVGTQWRPELAADWHIEPIRLEDIGRGSHQTRCRGAGYDLVIAWHEYASIPAWREAWEALDCDLVTFQHGTNVQYPAGTFDGSTARLYCYSPEMMALYGDHSPRQELAVHQGLGEDEPRARDGRDLVWIGRLDAVKAPHIAVLAAARLGRRIRIAGPVFDPVYLELHRRLFDSPHVELLGEIGGAAKIAALHLAEVLVYTCSRDYVEAGAAVFGEALRAGTPVAAMAWRDGTCAEVALCAETGCVARIDPADDDDEAAAALADAIEKAAMLRAASVQEIGITRFDPARHFLALASRSA